MMSLALKCFNLTAAEEGEARQEGRRDDPMCGVLSAVVKGRIIICSKGASIYDVRTGGGGEGGSQGKTGEARQVQ